MESDDYGNVARYNGTRWLPEQHLGPVADLGCATATSCTAVLRDGRVDRWNGSTWTMGRFAPLGYTRRPSTCPASTPSTVWRSTTWARRTPGS